MVQKKSAAERRPRGRPRAYDPDIALARATEAFWKSGYAGTSLDELAAAARMNRPSLYAAFGDKQALYLRALERYWTMGLEAMREMLAYDRPLPEALMRVYQSALDIYFSGKGPARGCFAIGTAATAAVDDPRIRAVFAQGLRKLDEGFAARIRAAAENGELPVGADPEGLAVLASATLHTLALRARAGTVRPELEKMARRAVSILCNGDRSP
jgi:AcrR family transcriptional regulator